MMKEDGGEISMLEASRDNLMKGLGLKRTAHDETPQKTADTLMGYLAKASFGAWNNMSWAQGAAQHGVGGGERRGWGKCEVRGRQVQLGGGEGRCWLCRPPIPGQNQRWFVLNIGQGVLCYYKRKPKEPNDERCAWIRPATF